MPTSDRTEEIAAAMADPRFYPHRPAEVTVRETHISWVFLAGELAFKLRKAVSFPFLDYGTAERRRQMCEEEVRLGCRLAPTLYVGLEAVVLRDGGFALAEAGDPSALEHVVAMRRFDEACTLAARLERGTRRCGALPGGARGARRLRERIRGRSPASPAAAGGAR